MVFREGNGLKVGRKKGKANGELEEGEGEEGEGEEGELKDHELKDHELQEGKRRVINNNCSSHY